MPAFASDSGNAGGIFTWNGVTYKIVSNTLYSYDLNGTATSIGTILGSNIATFAATATQMVICRNGRVYSYDGTTLALETDADFETPEFVDLINEQAIYDGDNNRFGISDVRALATLNALNTAASVGVNTGSLKRIYVFGETIYYFFDNYVYQYWNSGVGNPPVDRINNSTTLVGTLEPRSIAHNQNFMYWLGSDSTVYRTQAGEAQKVTTIPRGTAFRTQDLTNAHGLCWSSRGQEFYSIYFPRIKETWVYNEQGGWFQLTYKSTEEGIPLTGYTENYSKQLFEVEGDILELDDDVYQVDSQQMIRERTSDKITARVFGRQYAKREVEHNKITVLAEIIGLVDEKAVLVLGISDDRGETWDYINIVGDFLDKEQYLFELDDLGTAYDRRYRLRVSGNYKASIQGGSLEVELGI